VVRTRLEDAGAKVGGMSSVGSQAEGGVLRLLVGPWSAIRRDPAARRLEGGPKVSGVFALPSPKGDHLALLDPRGVKVRSLGAGSGLVAATRFLDQQPTWVVTGTDAVGVDAAAAALDETRLKDHFAVAIENGSGIPLPLPAGGGTVNP
jgi:hypothetical protein